MKPKRYLLPGIVMAAFIFVSFANARPRPAKLDADNPPSIEDIVSRKVEALKNTLELDEEIAQAVSDLFTASLTRERGLQEEIKALKEDTKTKFLDLLTEEQKEKLEATGRIDRMFGPKHRGPMPPHAKGRMGGPHPDFKAMSEEIGITEEQHQAIRSLIEEQNIPPREAFKQVLTEEQQEKLAELRKNRPDRRRGGDPAKMLDRIGEAVGITEEQRATIDRLISGDEVTLREALNQVLSEEQKEKLAELRKNRVERGEHNKGSFVKRGKQGERKRPARHHDLDES